VRQRDVIRDTAAEAKLSEALSRATAWPDHDRLAALEAEDVEVSARLAEKAGAHKEADPNAPKAPPKVDGKPLGPMSEPDPALMTPEVKRALESAVITANRLVLPDTLDRKLYEKVNRALESAGGVWSKKVKAHVFLDDPSAVLGLTPKEEAPVSANQAAINALMSGRDGKLPEAPKRYRYEMRARPPGINTHPTEGLIAHTEGGNRHGYLDYNRRLTDEEVYNFELRPEEAEEPENRPERLAKGRTSVEPATNATILAMARKNPGLIESSMDDAADDTVRDAYEARHLAAAEALDYRMPESMRQYSNAPTAQLRTLGLLFRAIAKQPGAFLLGPLTPAQQSAKTLDESLRAYNVPFLYTEEMSGRPATVIYLEPPADVPEEYQVPRYSFEIQAEKQPGTYSINSLMGAGKHATPLYQAIYTWAHNNGFQIVPDSGYTDAGAFRRISHMLSSALRHGTTKHFTPHTKQVPALAGLSGTPEAFAEDIGLLSAIEADLTIAKAPFLSDIWDEYDLDRALHDSSSAATGRITAGLQATKVRLNQENSDAPLHVGAATAKRAFLAHHRLLSDTLRGDTGRQLSGVAGRQSEERRERESLLTNKVLYKGTTTVSQSPSPLAKLGWNHLDRATTPSQNESIRGFDTLLQSHIYAPGNTRTNDRDRAQSAATFLKEGISSRASEEASAGNRRPWRPTAATQAEWQRLNQDTGPSSVDRNTEEQALVEWAAENGLLFKTLPAQWKFYGPDDVGMMKHHVFWADDKLRWIKITSSGSYGIQPFASGDGYANGSPCAD
jgi:hypothetical protein